MPVQTGVLTGLILLRCALFSAPKGVEIMKYISVKQAAELWNLSERSVRNYCAQGRIDGAFLTGKTWDIP